MVALVGVWVFGLTGLVLSSSFYARGDTLTPSIVAVAGFVVAIAIKLAGFSIAGPSARGRKQSLPFPYISRMLILIRMQHLRRAQ